MGLPSLVAAGAKALQELKGAINRARRQNTEQQLRCDAQYTMTAIRRPVCQDHDFLP